MIYIFNKKTILRLILLIYFSLKNNKRLIQSKSNDVVVKKESTRYD